MGSPAARAYDWIDTDDRLEALAGTLAGAGEFAVDTESDGFHHYFDKLCLLQLSTRERNFIVDPLSVRSLAPLRDVLEDSDVPKVLHAAEQDLMYLRRDHGIAVRGLFDTLLAAQFLGHTHLGLAALLEEHFGVKLSKSSQLDDWSRRPLTEKQLRYAVSDTDRLLPLRDRLMGDLRQKDRLVWAEEECRALEARSVIPERVDPDDVTRVKGWKELSLRGRAILRELLRARDREARRRDRSPFRVVGNVTLLALAATPPETVQQVRAVKGFPHQRRGGLDEKLLAAVRTGLHLPESKFPEAPRQRGRRPVAQRDAGFDQRLESLREWRKKASEALGLQLGVVAPQRDLELLANAAPTTPPELDTLAGIRSWRKREFGTTWLAVLDGGATAPGR